MNKKQPYYSDCIITKHSGGFGMYQTGEYSDLKWSYESDLIDEIAGGDLMLPIAEALTNQEFIDLDIRDIRGLVNNEPDSIYCKIEDDKVIYIGVSEMT